MSSNTAAVSAPKSKSVAVSGSAKIRSFGARSATASTGVRFSLGLMGSTPFQTICVLETEAGVEDGLEDLPHLIGGEGTWRLTRESAELLFLPVRVAAAQAVAPLQPR